MHIMPHATKINAYNTCQCYCIYNSILGASHSSIPFCLHNIVNPLTVLNCIFKVLFRLVTPFFTCISTSAVSQPWKLEPQHMSTLTTPTHQRAFNSQGPPTRERPPQTESCLKCQKWSLYKAKGVFSRPVCARKQNNGPPGIDYSQLQQMPCTVTVRVTPTYLSSSHPFCQCTKWIMPTENMQPNFDDYSHH